MYNVSNVDDNSTLNKSENDYLQLVGVLPAFYHTIVASLGIPINAAISWVILISRPLWQPRHLTWLTLMTCNILAQCQKVLEFLSASQQSPPVCFLYSLLYGTPYLLLNLSYVFVVIERHTVLCCPDWHQKYINKRMIFYLVACYVCVTCTVACVQWWLMGDDVCANNRFKINRYLPFIHLILHSVCLYFEVKIVCAIWRLFRQFPSLRNRRNGGPKMVFRSSPNYVSSRQMASFQTQHADQDYTDTHVSKNIFKPDPNRLEVYLTLSLIIAIIPQLLFNFPYAVISCIYVVWIYLSPSSTWMLSLHPYLLTGFIINVVCSPLLYVAISKEFRRCLRRLWPPGG